MKTNRNYHTTVILFLLFGLLLISCKPNEWEVNLNPNNPQPVFSVEIGDMEEARILEQEMKLEILRIDQNRLYFLQPDANILDSLKEYGYALKKADKMKMYFRVVQIHKDTIVKKEELFKKYGVQFINEEKDYYIIRGDLAQLKNMKRHKIKLIRLSEEVKPRVVSIYVPSKSDIQKVSELQVDIFIAELQDDSTYVIHGQAFDYQIEAIRNNDYTVQIQP